MTEDGSSLFTKVDEVLKTHYYLKEPWHYAIASLWVFQAWITQILPAVFYLSIGGPIGSGKTNFIYLLADLTEACKFENVSIAALAREIGKNCRPVVFDEVTAKREKELTEARDALIRQGYKANAAPYTRWDAFARKAEKVPIYSAKAFGFTGALDAALQSRCYALPSVTPKPGLDSYEYVIRNLWPKTQHLIGPLKDWRRNAIIDWNPNELEALAETSDFKSRIQQATMEIGANRESELTTIAMLVAEVVGIDLVSDLKNAQQLRAAETASSSDLVDAFLRTFRLYLNSNYPAAAVKAQNAVVRVKQSDVKAEWDEYCRSYLKRRPMGPNEFAELRENAGISRSVLVLHGGSAYLNLDQETLAKIFAAEASP